ncbi:MAG: FtsH protease activity modulator HflK [Gemmataceae bacterium]
MSPRRYYDDDLPDEQEGVTWPVLLRYAPWVVLGLLGIYLAWDSFHTVAAHEQAVVLRFGKFHSIEGPGLHLKVPLMDKAVPVRMDEQRLRLPFALPGETPGHDGGRARTQEPLILTGDLYAAVVEWNVNWRVIDAQKFILSINADQVEPTIMAVARSAMHRMVGDYSADEILTTRREEVGLAALNRMQQAMDGFDCGVQIVAIQMQRVTPPERVKPSFDEVNASLQQRSQLVNEAQRKRNEMIPKAVATRDQLQQEARGYADRRRAEAEGEIKALLAKYEEYRKAPELTRRRLYLEAMEEIIARSGPKTVLDADLNNLLPLLNLGPNNQPPAGKR